MVRFRLLLTRSRFAGRPLSTFFKRSTHQIVSVVTESLQIQSTLVHISVVQRPISIVPYLQHAINTTLISPTWSTFQEIWLATQKSASPVCLIDIIDRSSNAPFVYPSPQHQQFRSTSTFSSFLPPSFSSQNHTSLSSQPDVSLTSPESPPRCRFTKTISASLAFWVLTTGHFSQLGTL